MVFQGDAFETLPDLMTFKSIFLDFFRGDPKADLVDLKGLEHVLTLTAVSETQVCLRVYNVVLLKSKETPDLPRLELKEMGPRLDLTLKRVRSANPEAMKQATKVPKELLPKKEKNIEHDAVGHQYGRIHMEKQDLNKLETRKMKGLKGVKRLAKTKATATDVNV
jgi:ribosome production factor 2